MVKSLKDISWLVDEPTYRADSAYSYSTISKFNREGFNKIETLFDKVESPSLLFGSVVDCILTDGEEAFKDRFFVATFPDVNQDFIPMLKAIEDEVGNVHSTLNTLTDKEIVGYLNRFGLYQNNWYDATKAQKVRQACGTYYQMLLLSKDKTLVSSEMVEDARACVEALRTSEATRWYFRDSYPFEDTERLYQLKFKGEYEGIPLRCMADLIIVDHKDKLIIPCDLKTSFKPEYDFYKSFIEWGYWIQSQLYSEIIRQNIIKDDYFKDFKIADYRFIVVCNKTRNPKVWEFKHTKSDVDLTIGNVKLPNWRNIVKNLDYYLKYKPKSPIGIEETEINCLDKWIEHIGE